MCSTYNGWINRETWATALWIDNEQGLYEEVADRVAEIVDTNEIADITTAKREIADYLEEFITELLDIDSIFENRVLFTMLTDIGSLYRVKWWDIAEGYYTEYTETPEFVARLDEENQEVDA